jgi:hypothetical protein
MRFGGRAAMATPAQAPALGSTGTKGEKAENIRAI